MSEKKELSTSNLGNQYQLLPIALCSVRSPLAHHSKQRKNLLHLKYRICVQGHKVGIFEICVHCSSDYHRYGQSVHATTYFLWHLCASECL